MAAWTPHPVAWPAWQHYNGSSGYATEYSGSTIEGDRGGEREGERELQRIEKVTKAKPWAWALIALKQDMMGKEGLRGCTGGLTGR